MKICILTQKLGNNYGGILQAFALQFYLKQEGHIVETVHHPGNQRISFRVILFIVKQAIKKYILQRKVNSIIPFWIYKKKQNIVYQNMYNFIKQHITLTPLITNFKKLNQRGYGAYIVGSDQVWRPKYNKHQFKEMFFSFVKKDDVKKLSYAASFGVDHLEFTEQQMKKISRLLKKFDAVSVREKSGVDLCRDHFHIEAQQVLDPTMLLSKSDYLALISPSKFEGVPEGRGSLFIYVLDQSPEVSQLVQQIADELHEKPYYFLPTLNEPIIMPSVTTWLKGFANAQFVVTDSFHGTVFAILFNKPFLVYANKQRGATRFHSLLKMFRLEDRLVLDTQENVIEKVKKTIDWENVNQILEKERTFSSAFLKNALNNI